VIQPLPGSVSDRFRETFELFDLGLAMVRQQLRNRFPQAADREIEAKLAAWLHDRPGAEQGDAGPVGFRLRTRRP